MSRIFELFKIVLRRLACVKCSFRPSWLLAFFLVVQFVLDSCRLSRLVQVVFGCCSVAQVVLCCFSSL